MCQRSSVISEVSNRCKSLLLGPEDGSENHLIKQDSEMNFNEPVIKSIEIMVHYAFPQKKTKQNHEIDHLLSHK